MSKSVHNGFANAAKSIGENRDEKNVNKMLEYFLKDELKNKTSGNATVCLINIMNFLSGNEHELQNYIIAKYYDITFRPSVAITVIDRMRILPHFQRREIDPIYREEHTRKICH